ncbi:tescalcin b isoform X3 [Gadus morhua]|uniref:tescalcin b isoform X3 n=1 Tax=Gadus morhua TaxID=8049 RepID=UPI0011B666E9|nr:calcineurin B homologous protein 3-like isoform X3 [Gadus morhua]
MGALNSLPDEPQYVGLAEKTGFSFEQIGILHKRFKQLSNNGETLRREDFNTIPDLLCNPIRSEIIEAFFDRRNFRQTDAVGTVHEIGFGEFLLVMSHFRPPSIRLDDEQKEVIRTEKLRFLFNMHDTDNDGTITLEEYRHEPDEFYEGITFEHFNKLLKEFEVESRMNIRFMNMDTTTLCK